MSTSTQPDAGAAADAPDVSVDEVVARLRHRRDFLMGDINEATAERADVNEKLKADRARIEAQAKERRAVLNERIAGRRAELAKVERFLAAEKPRGQRGTT